MSLPDRPEPRPTDAHKGTAGRVLVLAGSRWMPGAGVLAATGALRAGAGLVTLAGRSETALDHAVGARPELLLWQLEDRMDASALEAEFEERRFDAVVVGPGLPANKRTERLLAGLLAAWDGALVLDAGALSVLAADKALTEAVRARTQLPAILTPHPGEAAQLLGGAAISGFRASIGATEAERGRAAAELALRFNAITVLKGAGTLVADVTGERIWRCSAGNPGMATGGTGDVLAGMLGALVSEVADPSTLWHRARTAVHWHALAGDLAAADLGQRALLASDVADALGPAELEGPWA